MRQIHRFTPSLISEANTIVQATGGHEDYKHVFQLDTKIKGEAVSTYGDLVAQQSKRKIYFYNSYNWKCEICDEYKTGGIKGVRQAVQARKERYSKKQSKQKELDDRANAEYIFIPINKEEADHWILGVIDTKNVRLLVYDSLQSKRHKQVLECMKIFAEEYAKPGLEWNYDNTSYVTLLDQGPTVDCGIYIMAYMRSIAHARHQEIDFERKDIPFLRALFLYELYHKSLKTVGI